MLARSKMSKLFQLEKRSAVGGRKQQAIRTSWGADMEIIAGIDWVGNQTPPPTLGYLTVARQSRTR